MHYVVQLSLLCGKFGLFYVVNFTLCGSFHVILCSGAHITSMYIIVDCTLCGEMFIM